MDDGYRIFHHYLFDPSAPKDDVTTVPSGGIVNERPRHAVMPFGTVLSAVDVFLDECRLSDDFSWWATPALIDPLVDER